LRRSTEHALTRIPQPLLVLGADQVGDALSDELPGRVAEDAPARLVDERVAAFGIGHEDSVRSEVDHGAQCIGRRSFHDRHGAQSST
jgi:hypothetical protein